MIGASRAAALFMSLGGSCTTSSKNTKIISKIGIDSVKVSGRNIVVSEGVYRYTYDLDGNHLRTDTRM
jgi:hypothetical protein